MKLKQIFAVGLLVSTPAFASASFLVDFEKTWDYANGDVNGYYNGGFAADGSTGGANLGVEFVNVSGLSNDANFTYYTNAPSMVGTAYAHDTAYINVAAGVEGNLSFYYSSPSDVIGAITAWSGLNGTGTLLGSFDLVANDLGGASTLSGNFGQWTATTFNFNGVAQSFNLTAASGVGFDNISSVPVPAAIWLLGSGLAMIGAVGRRGKSAA